MIATSYADWQSRQEGHLGDLLRAMREVFQKARDLAPCILFIDELDSINSRGSSIRNEDWWRAVINALLAELDGIDPREGVVIIGATNYPQSIDPAIRRAGRMDREILISLPDVAALVKIFALHLGDALETSLRESSDEAFKASDLRRLAELSVGRSGADIAKICRGSKRRARTARRALTFNDVYAEIGGELSDPNDPIAQRSAIYEASRAVILARLYPGLATAAAIGGGGKLSGHALFSVDALAAPTARGIENLLVVLLAGRAGEDIIYGEISASAGGSSGSDLARATRLAVFMDASLGLGKGGGIWSEVGDSNDIDRYFAANPGGRIAVSARLSMAYERAKKIVTGDRTAVSLIAQALLHRNVLMAEEVGQILKEGERIPEPELEDMLLTETRH